MLDRVKYINSQNEVINFGKLPYLINENDLRDFKWQYERINNKITSFKRGIVEKTIPCIILSNPDAKNHLYEVFEKDVIANTPGKLVIGEYYLSCYITASEKSDYTNSYGLVSIDLNVVCESCIWYKETIYQYNVISSIDTDITDVKKYSYGYNYGYINNNVNKQIINDSIGDCGFKIIIYGPCTNPLIVIDGYEYKINTALETGEYLTITSLGDIKTVIKTKNNGQKVNEFNKRNKAYSVFKKIRQGINTVAWNGSFKFDIVLIEERSEPKWI